MSATCGAAFISADWFLPHTPAQSTGERIKSVLSAGGGHPEVEVELDWKESIAHPDDRRGPQPAFVPGGRRQVAGWLLACQRRHGP